MKCLGNIVAAAQTAVNNSSTADAFLIPPGAKYLCIEVVADAGGSGDTCYAEIGTEDSFQTAASTGLLFSSTSPLQLAVPNVQTPVLSLYNGNTSASKTFRVLAAAGPAFT